MKVDSWGVLSAMVALLLTGCGAATSGSGTIVESDRTPSSAFSEVEVDQSFLNGRSSNEKILQVNVSIGSTRSVKLRGDDNLLEKVSFRVENGVLIAELSTLLSISPSEGVLVVDVVTPSLTQFRALGATGAKISGLDTSGFTLEVGRDSVVEVQGRSDRFTVLAASNSEVKAKDLRSQELTVGLLDGAKVQATATHSVKGWLAMWATLECFGQPDIHEMETSSHSTVSYPVYP